MAKANIDLLGTGGPILAMMLGGAAGFYLGIDLPPPPPHRVLPVRGHRNTIIELMA